MADSKYFGIPFATSGDKATIPEATQPSGAISFTQGFGPDYERDPATDPLAKRVPRDETNELYFQVTNALKYLQLYGTPEWYALDNAGNPVSYPLSARVRHDAGAGMQAWRSLVASNTVTPGSDATKWALDTPFDLSALEATLAEAIAGSSGSKLITPRRLSSSVQRGVWKYAAAAGTANAITAVLSPVPAALTVGLVIDLLILATNTGPMTINLNALGAVAITDQFGKALTGGEAVAGQIRTLVYNGTTFAMLGTAKPRLSGNTDFYVATSGNDTTGDGSSGAPWATVQKAIDTLTGKYDFAGFTGTVNVANGTYPAFQNSLPVDGKLIISGNVSSPSSVIISSSGDCISSFNSSVFSIRGLKMVSSGGLCLYARVGGKIAIIGPVDFGSAASGHIGCQDTGSYVGITSSYTISGGCVNHFNCNFGQAQISIAGPITVTISGTPALSDRFARAADLGLINLFGGVTFSGSMSGGSKYVAVGNAVIDTGGAGIGFFPGAGAGSTSEGGIYR